MSKAVIPVPVMAIEDPMTRLGRPTAFGVTQGGIVYTYQPINANSTSSSNITFVAPPPSPDIIVDRRVYLSITWLVTAAGTSNGGAPFGLGSTDGPRAFPNMQAINTLSAVINNNTITQQMDPIIALMRYQLKEWPLQKEDYSSAPAQQDQFQDYGQWATLGSARNPLDLMGENSFQTPRGGFQLVVNNNAPVLGALPTGGSAPSVQFTSIEPFFMTPFAQWGEDPGFFGVQTLNINLQMNSNLNRVWSHDAKNGNPITLTTSIVGTPQLLFRYITPSPIRVMPSVMEYAYSALNIYITGGAGTVGNQSPTTSASPSANQVTTSSSIQFNTIPDQIFVYLFRTLAQRDESTSDTFGVIQSVSINFMNQTGLLATATQWDLYNMSRKNGYVGSFQQWGQPGYSGSVLCIKPGLDLGLEPSLAPSMNGLYNFQITVTWFGASNGWTRAAPSGSSTTYDLYVVPITSGIVTIKDNGTVTQTGLVTRADVLRAQAAPSMGMNEARFLVGGDFFGSLKNFLGRSAGAVRNVAQMGLGLAGAISPWASAAAPLMRMIAGAGLYGGGAEPPQPGAEPGSEGQGTVGYGQQYKRKEMMSEFDDPRERQMPRFNSMVQQPQQPQTPPWAGYGDPRAMVGGQSPQSPTYTQMQMQTQPDPFADEPDDRYAREAPYADGRSPAERYDQEMDAQFGPPERVSRRRAAEPDLEPERPTRGAVFR